MWFNAQQVAPAAPGSGSLPIGKHKVVILGSDEKMTKANDPQIRMLVFKLQIIEGGYQGIGGEYRLNLWNPNDQAVSIAAAELSALCHVIGVYQLAVKPYGAELFNRPFMIEVGPQKNDPKYTEIVGVYDLNGNAPGKAGAGPQPQQAGGGFGQQPPQQQPQQVQPVQQGWGGQPQGQPPQQNGGFQPPQQPPQGGAAPSWNGAGQGQPQPQAQPSNNGAAWGGAPVNGAGAPPAGPAWGPR